jgi:hypothetical protein
LLGELATGYERVWVISAFQPNEHSLPTEATLKAHFGEEEERSFGFVRAELFADKIPESIGDRVTEHGRQ